MTGGESMSKRFALAFVVCISVACLIGVLRASARHDQGGSTAPRKAVGGRMSSAGRFAHRHSKAVNAGLEARVLAHLSDLLGDKPADKAGCIEDEDCGEAEGLDEGPPSTQSEVSIAIDRTGRHVVIGFNDFRGFDNASNPTSLSGFMYSDDGGDTFVDGGQLPTPGNDAIGATKYPQVFGDPELKYLGGWRFVYFSIMVKKFGATGTAQTMGVHRSTDYGHTWQGPFEIPGATNPNNLLSGVNARDAA